MASHSCGHRDWRKTAASLLASTGRPEVYLAFIADHDPATGRSWCPDCVKAEGPIRAAAAAAGAPLLTAYVGDRATWRDPGHPLREELRLTGVPTLLAWGSGGPGRRLGPELEAACSAEEAMRLAAAFFRPVGGAEQQDR